MMRVWFQEVRKGSPWEESCGFWSGMRSGWRGVEEGEPSRGSQWQRARCPLPRGGRVRGRAGSEEAGRGSEEREEAKQTASGFQKFTARVRKSLTPRVPTVSITV
jgi:hypothetical protein